MVRGCVTLKNDADRFGNPWSALLIPIATRATSVLQVGVRDDAVKVRLVNTKEQPGVVERWIEFKNVQCPRIFKQALISGYHQKGSSASIQSFLDAIGYKHEGEVEWEYPGDESVDYLSQLSSSRRQLTITLIEALELHLSQVKKVSLAINDHLSRGNDNLCPAAKSEERRDRAAVIELDNFLRRLRGELFPKSAIKTPTMKAVKMLVADQAIFSDAKALLEFLMSEIVPQEAASKICGIISSARVGTSAGVDLNLVELTRVLVAEGVKSEGELVSSRKLAKGISAVEKLLRSLTAGVLAQAPRRSEDWLGETETPVDDDADFPRKQRLPRISIAPLYELQDGSVLAEIEIDGELNVESVGDVIQDLSQKRRDLTFTDSTGAEKRIPIAELFSSDENDNVSVKSETKKQKKNRLALPTAKSIHLANSANREWYREYAYSRVKTIKSINPNAQIESASVTYDAMVQFIDTKARGQWATQMGGLRELKLHHLWRPELKDALLERGVDFTMLSQRVKPDDLPFELKLSAPSMAVPRKAIIKRSASATDVITRKQSSSSTHSRPHSFVARKSHTSPRPSLRRFQKTEGEQDDDSSDEISA